MRSPFLVATLLTCLAASAFADEASLRRAIEHARAEDSGMLNVDLQFDIPTQRAQEAVSRAVLAPGDPAAVVARVAKALSISEAAAGPLIEARLRQASAMSEEDPVADALLEEAVRLAPRNVHVLAYYAACSQQRPDEWVTARLLPLVRKLPAAEVATVAGAAEGKLTMLISTDGLSRAPEEAALYEELSGLYDDALTQTFGPVRVSSGKGELRSAWRGSDAKTTARDASQQIGALAADGRSADAIAVFDALPLAARTAMLAGPIAKDGGALDMRVVLAECALVERQPDRARVFLTSYRPVASQYHRDPNNEHAIYAEIVKTLLQPAIEGDVYDLLAKMINEARPQGGVSTLVAVQLAQRGGYESVATALLRQANRWSRDEIGRAALQRLPKPLQSELERSLADSAAALAAVHSRASHVATREGLMKRLAVPKRKPFAERHLETATDGGAAAVIDCGDAQRVASTMHLPSGCYPIRLERNGEEVAGIAISAALDPVGELGRGAYWVLHSTDGGRTWDAPLYTGLRESAPYLVPPASKLPLIHGDHLEVEVEVHELDPSSITFPPVALRTLREEKGLFLEMSWQALRHDSDGDGLTDLMEERLGTDPNAADSDGDGMSDARDGLPLVPLGAGRTPEAEVLAHVLKGFYAGGGAIVVGLPGNEEERNACVVRASNVGDGALFIVGDPALMTPIDINRRVIVFTPEELEAYEAKFGMTFAADVSLMIVRHDGRKALVVMNQRWAEDVLELTKTKDGWSVQKVGGYIT